MARFGALQFDSFRQKMGGEDSHPPARLIDTAQRDAAKFGEMGVVVADEGDISSGTESPTSSTAIAAPTNSSLTTQSAIHLPLEHSFG